MVNKPTKNDSNCNFKLEKVKRLINIKPKFKFMSLQISPIFSRNQIDSPGINKI